MSQGALSHHGSLHMVAARLRDLPRRRENHWLDGMRTFGALVVRGWMKAYHRFEIAGRENLPPCDQSFVMVSNHASHLDALCLLSALPLRRLKRAYPAAAEDYFFAHGIARLAAAAIFVNAVPFDRRPPHVRQSMDLCRRLLRERGSVLVLFPEGTRSRDGRLGEFRPGIGSLLAGLQVPVVPCAVGGTHRAMPKGTIIPRPRKLSLRIGLPRCYAELKQTRESARRISHELHDAVEELLACE